MIGLNIGKVIFVREFFNIFFLPVDNDFIQVVIVIRRIAYGLILSVFDVFNLRRNRSVYNAGFNLSVRLKDCFNIMVRLDIVKRIFRWVL